MTETDTIRERPAYLIRKRGMYYRPNSQGYTTNLIQAGRYTRSEAESITHPNGLDGPRDGMSFIHEDDKAGDEDWAAYRVAIDRAEKAEAQLVTIPALLAEARAEGIREAIEAVAQADSAELTMHGVTPTLMRLQALGIEQENK